MEAFRWASEKTGQAFEMGDVDESHTPGTCALGSRERRHDTAELAGHHQLHHREKAIASQRLLAKVPTSPTSHRAGQRGNTRQARKTRLEV